MPDEDTYGFELDIALDCCLTWTLGRMLKCKKRRWKWSMCEERDCGRLEVWRGIGIGRWDSCS